MLLLKPGERSHTYMGMATHYHLDTTPRGQPRWFSFFAQPNDDMANKHHYLHTRWASYKQPHSPPFVPSQYVDSHIYSWPGDPKLTLETSPGFVLYPCTRRPGKLDQYFSRRVNPVGVLAAGITPHIFRYRTTTAHSGMWILQGVDDVVASC